MEKPLLMLTLPNTGSTWLADIIAKYLPGAQYKREFFNPIFSPEHEGELATVFGSELVSCYRNIARRSGPAVEAVIKATWFKDGRYNFTKECISSPLKLASFLPYFRVFGLIRDDTMPPTRVRVWSFYEHAWHALVEAGWQLNAKTYRARATEAWEMLRREQLVDFSFHGIPVLNYAELGSVTAAKLAQCVGPELNAVACAHEIRSRFDPNLKQKLENVR